VKANGVVIRGSAATYHVKQLALQGVLDVVGSGTRTEIDLDVQVALDPEVSR
jgi:hypothetical protein